MKTTILLVAFAFAALCGSAQTNNDEQVRSAFTAELRLISDTNNLGTIQIVAVIGKPQPWPCGELYPCAAIVAGQPGRIYAAMPPVEVIRAYGAKVRHLREFVKETQGAVKGQTSHKAELDKDPATAADAEETGRGLAHLQQALDKAQTQLAELVNKPPTVRARKFDNYLHRGEFVFICQP